MKFMTMKNKNYAFDLQLFAEGGEGSNGDDSGEGDDQDGGEPDEGGEDEPEKKYSEKDMEEAIKKRLARERRKWQRQQDSSRKDDDKDSSGSQESEDNKALKAAENKASSLELKVACYEAGVSKDSVDDVVALAKAYMAADEELDFEDAIEKVVKKYPQFKAGTSSAEGTDEDETKGKSWGQRQTGKGSKKQDGVEAAFLKKNPGLKID